MARTNNVCGHLDKAHVAKGMCRLCYNRKYEIIPKCQTTRQRYNASQERKTVRHKYNTSSKGRAAQRKYEASPKGKATQRKWNSSSKGRAAHRKYSARPELKVDIQFRLRNALRSRISAAMRSYLSGITKGGSAVNDLGCTISDFVIYIESKLLPAMSWDNWGKGKGKWNLDHIFPLAKADLTDRKQFLDVAHFTNYQPLWENENISKSDRVAS